MVDNFYDILGINKNASQDEVKKAYRKLQMKWHPDKNHGNQDAINMTQKINEAYETLGDERKREEYDNPNPFMRMNSMGGQGMGGQGMGGMDIPVDDILNMFFGGAPGNIFGGFGGPGMPPGARVHVFNGSNMGSMGGNMPMGGMNFHQAMQKPTPVIKTLYVNMEQVLTGANIPLEIERWVIENGVKVHEQEIIYVNVPQGIDDGEIIVLRDKGNTISDTSKGDVKVFIKVSNDTLFKRSGLDLIYEKNITLKESLCGFSFEIKYLNGKSYTLNNNKGNIIPPEYKKVYPNMGLTRENHKGNMIIHFHVDFPENLTLEQIDKLVEIL
jgi:DnaJ-class molecular chaperone